MSDPVSLAEAKAFLRLEHGEEDALVARLLSAAKARVEAALGGEELDDEAPAAVRLAILLLVSHGFEERDGREPPQLAGWLAPYRTVRL